MKVVVTGGAGFVGSNLVRRLASSGHEVLAIDDLSGGDARASLLNEIGVILERFDIGSSGAADAVASFEPEVIFHLAAQTDVRRSVADPVHDATVNISGTLNILEAARGVGARFVHTSSGGVIYGEPSPDSLPLTEEAYGRPASPYGISKKVLEDYLRFYADVHDLRFVSLAPANIYGPGQDPSGEGGVVSIFGGRLVRGEPCTIYGDGKQTRDYIYVDDIVDAFVAAASRGDGETFNVGTGVETSVNDLYGDLAEICGVLDAPAYESARPGELERSALDSSKASRLLGWTPKTPLRQGLVQTVDWLRSTS